LRKDEKRQAANDYVTGDYLCQIFQEDMQSLYRLAFQATASHEHAEQCFFAGIKAPLNEYMVLKEWARPWSRRIAIKNEIRLISATPAESDEKPDRWAQADDRSATCTTIRAVIQLATKTKVLVATAGRQTNEKEIKALADTQAAMLTKLILANSRMQATLYKLLSREQQRKLDAFKRATEPSLRAVE